MMYRRVGNALLQAGSSAHPQDYLLFLTPLAREDEDEVPDCLEDNFEPGSNAEKLRSSRRLMIYVHSKLMVVDDSAAIIGVLLFESLISSVRSSYSHPDLIVIQQQHPLFQITPVLNTGLSLSEPLQLYKGQSLDLSADS